MAMIGRSPVLVKKVVLVALKGVPAYGEWLRDFADSQRSDPPDLIDDALEAYARAKNYPVPPKR